MPKLRICRFFTFSTSKYLYGIVFKYRNNFAFTSVGSTVGVTGICTPAAIPRIAGKNTLASPFSLLLYYERNYVSTVSRRFFDLSRQAFWPLNSGSISLYTGMFASIVMMVDLSAPFMFVMNGPVDFVTSWVAYSGMLPVTFHKLRFSSSIVIIVTPRRNWFVKINRCFQPRMFVTARKNFHEYWRTCSDWTETINRWKKIRDRCVSIQITRTLEFQVRGLLSCVGIGCLCVFSLLPASCCPTASYPRKCRNSHDQSVVNSKHLWPENPDIWP